MTKLYDEYPINLIGEGFPQVLRNRPSVLPEEMWDYDWFDENDVDYDGHCGSNQ